MGARNIRMPMIEPIVGTRYSVTRSPGFIAAPFHRSGCPPFPSSCRAEHGPEGHPPPGPSPPPPAAAAGAEAPRPRGRGRVPGAEPPRAPAGPPVSRPGTAAGPGLVPAAVAAAFLASWARLQLQERRSRPIGRTCAPAATGAAACGTCGPRAACELVDRPGSVAAQLLGEEEHLHRAGCCPSCACPQKGVLGGGGKGGEHDWTRVYTDVQMCSRRVKVNAAPTLLASPPPPPRNHLSEAD